MHPTPVCSEFVTSIPPPPPPPCRRLELHMVCRMGDLRRVQELLEGGYYCSWQDGGSEDVNQIDPYDGTTPLYHAALGGHVEVCEYLLEHGAIVTPSIVAVALGDNLQNRLRAVTRRQRIRTTKESHTKKNQKNKSGSSYKDSTTTHHHHHPPHHHCSNRAVLLSKRLHQVFHQQRPEYSDLSMNVGSSSTRTTTFYLHKAMLAIRCPQLLQQILLLQTCDEPTAKNDGKQLPQPSRRSAGVIYWPWDTQISVIAVRKLLEYIYTGFWEGNDDIPSPKNKNDDTQSTDEDCETDDDLFLNETLDLAQLWGLDLFIETFRLQRLQIQNKLDRGWKVPKRFSINHRSQLPVDMDALFQQAPHSDAVIVTQDGCTNPIHRFLLCSAFPYFQTALSGHFQEAQNGKLRVQASSPTVMATLRWMYTLHANILDTTMPRSSSSSPSPPSSVNHFDDNHVIICIVELVDLASQWLLSKFVNTIVDTVLLPIIDAEHVYDLWELAKLYRIRKLERACQTFLTYNSCSSNNENKMSP